MLRVAWMFVLRRLSPRVRHVCGRQRRALARWSVAATSVPPSGRERYSDGNARV